MQDYSKTKSDLQQENIWRRYERPGMYYGSDDFWSAAGVTNTTQEGCFSGKLSLYLENIHHCLWFRSAVQHRSVPNRIPVGFLSSFLQGCSTLSSQHWQSPIPKPERGHVGLRRCLSPCTHTHSHTLQLNAPTHEPATIRHLNVSVSSRWSVFGNLELSQVIPNY